MRPESDALHVLSTTRAKAKMHEFRIPLDDHIDLPRNPTILFSLAVGILGDAAAAIADSLLTHEEDGFSAQGNGEAAVAWNPRDDSMRATSLGVLKFAATYFDAFLESRLENSITHEFSLLCAASYYLADSPGSGRVVIRSTPAPEPDFGGGLPRLAHAILNDNFTPIGGDHRPPYPVEHLLEALHAFFAMEADAPPIEGLCQSLHEQAYDAGSPRELLYADIVTALCRRKLDNASRTLLPKASGLDLAAWQPALQKSHFPRELWPAQKRICDAGMLRGRSAVIQMPTSAGKTRATELIIRSAFLANRTSLAVIVAPFRSLCHDIRGDLARAFAGENVALDEATDSYQFDLALDELLAKKAVLIVTPEKLLYILRRAPELSERIGLVIYDEGHQFDGMTRGPTFELLLTSLKISLSPAAQRVLISAVIGNAPEVAAWLIGDPNAVIGGDGLIPTTKSIAFASWRDARGRLEYVSPQDPDESEFYVPRVIEAMTLNNLPGERVKRVFPKRKGTEIGLYLGLQLVANGSVAVFCGRKDSAALLCDRAVELFKRQAGFTWPAGISDAEEVQKIATLFKAHLGVNAGSAQAAAIGIFPHHSNVPHGLRLSIEHAMKENLAKFVICTSTLAQGVNFPIKYLIVTTTQQGQERIMVRDFHNLIGRAGRAGMHTEGSVVFSYSDLYDKRMSQKGRWRWQQAKNLLDPTNAEPCASSILSIFEPYEQSDPGFTLDIDEVWLRTLAFADDQAIQDAVRQALAATPKINERQYWKYLNDRARAVHAIVAFLVSHVAFEEDSANERVL
jgi:superfamily II DNA/RNA helicase